VETIPSLWLGACRGSGREAPPVRMLGASLGALRPLAWLCLTAIERLGANSAAVRRITCRAAVIGTKLAAGPRHLRCSDVWPPSQPPGFVRLCHTTHRQQPLSASLQFKPQANQSVDSTFVRQKPCLRPLIQFVVMATSTIDAAPSSYTSCSISLTLGIGPNLTPAMLMGL
jgi:hypothetical protein